MVSNLNIIKALIISEKIQQYNNALDAIQQKRKTWSETTKPLLVKVLNEIKKLGSIDCSVQDFKTGTNQETVNYVIDKRHSGLTTVDEKGERALIKKSAAIAFTTSYNGDIFVILNYPYIEEHISQIPSQLIEKISPEKITEEYIVDKIVLFFDEVIAWEKGVESPRTK